MTIREIEKALPKSNILQTRYYNKKGTLLFVLALDSVSGGYILYEPSDTGKLNRLGKGKSPFDLEKKYDVNNKCKA